ncbi:Sucrase/ferredoxin-like protein [Actinomadura rubteroloni]|uniref:Sucrase/ferredoxin-like protein n=1 Tax=Actinomadura rubteroloni TaxID=1926885 RepID=A0A2P4UDD2_9ACTN|nr:sucrase ferredoxin [Actinomadura rubteroloni]POM23059.1 Sucrase/ferredoxin-like protein [Actinomadura rubteroloni]
MTRDNGCDHCPGSHSGERPCLASATTGARSWLLVEHPGPWPERVEDLPAGPVGDAVRAARAAGVRPQLVRRPGRRRATPPVQVYAGYSAPGAKVWLEGRELADPAELAGLDFAALAAGRSPGLGDRVPGPVLLVCTHGRRNACCARTGAPLARALARRFPGPVWETTHVGGDRFAANLVCLPHALYYGDLGTAEAVDAVTAYTRGEVAPARLRGRAGQPEPVQAAEHFVRARTGVLGIDAVRVESLTGTSPYEAVVSAGEARYRVVIERAKAAAPCGPDCRENLETYIVRDLTLLNAAALV